MSHHLVESVNKFFNFYLPGIGKTFIGTDFYKPTFFQNFL